MTFGKDYSLPRWLKSGLDYLPLILFFIFFRLYGLFPATVALVIATLITSVVLFITQRKIPLLALITLIIVLVFGGAALIFQDEFFIKIKPTLVQLFFAISLAGSSLMKRPVIKHILSDSIDLSARDWRILSWRFAGFFLVGALLNEWVWRTQTTATWVNFKVFGLTALSFIFLLSQLPFLLRRSKDTSAGDTSAGDTSAGLKKN